jgi:hypothetical protein
VVSERGNLLLSFFFFFSFLVEEFCEYQAESVREWTPNDQAVIIEEFVSEMKPKLEKDFPTLIQFLPREINLYLTAGYEETGLFDDTNPKTRVGYCRGKRSVNRRESFLLIYDLLLFFKQVFLSRKCMDFSDKEAAKHLLWHELWHILSRNMDAANLDQIYEIFGFQRMARRLSNTHPHRLTNPDALFFDHKIEIEQIQ